MTVAIYIVHITYVEYLLINIKNQVRCCLSIKYSVSWNIFKKINIFHSLYIYRSCSCMVECTTRIYCWELKKKGVVSLNEFKPRSKYSAKFKHMIVFSILLRCYYMLYGLVYLVYAISNTIINDNLITKLKTFSDCMIKVIEIVCLFLVSIVLKNQHRIIPI